MVKRITDVKIGDPMGFKLLEDDCDANTLDIVLDTLKVYHGDKYIVGKDTDIGVNKRPHYHIHFFAVKEVKEGALKTFRCTMGKKIPSLSKGSRLYTGQDLPSSDPNQWLGYAIKETQVKVSGYSITDEILISAQSQKQVKQMKAVASEKKANDEKEKKDFNQKLVEYVKENLDKYEIPHQYQQTLKDKDKIRLLIIRYLMENEKIGSIKKGIIDTHFMRCCIQIYGWDECKVYGNVYIS